MTTQKRLLTRLSIIIALVSLAPSLALAGDESFNSVVKHIKSNYHAKQQSFFGAIGRRNGFIARPVRVGERIGAVVRA